MERSLVYAERKDINPLIVEYQGDKWQDYPDPNYQPTDLGFPFYEKFLISLEIREYAKIIGIDPIKDK